MDRCSKDLFDIFKINHRETEKGMKNPNILCSSSIYEEAIYISCCWFCICFKRIYFGTPSNDCFWNIKKMFLTTRMYMKTRDAFTAASQHRIGLKRYLMNRYLIVTKCFILISQICLDQGENSCSFKEKGGWLVPKLM